MRLLQQQKKVKTMSEKSLKNNTEGLKWTSNIIIMINLPAQQHLIT